MILLCAIGLSSLELTGEVRFMLRWIWSCRLPSLADGGVLWWTWCVLSLLVVVLGPSQLLNGVPFWDAPLSGVGQALLEGMTFLVLVVFLGMNRRNGARLVTASAAAAICYGTASWVLLRVRPDLAYSPDEFVLAAALGVPLAMFPYFLFSSRRILGVTFLASVLGVVLFLGLRPQLTGGAKRAVVSTALKVMSVTVYSNLFDPGTMDRGGAIERYGKSFLLVTGDGAFYTLDWATSGESLVAHRLTLSLPRDPGTAPADQKRLVAVKMHAHRVTDIVLDTAAEPPNVIVAYQEWNAANKCFTVRVAVAALMGTKSEEQSPGEVWKRIFETQPCLPLSQDLQYLESGGRLGWLGDKLLLTVGDFGLGESVHPPLSQSDDNSYGKVLLLDRSGRHEVFSRGHRNPQGLLVDREQRIWLTEHGPQGGDELNLLQKGRNYGWPYATYGTGYGRLFWPLAPGAHDHGEFAEPVHAFVPSIAISNLIRVQSRRVFPEWHDDLLIGSLRARTLFRARIRDDRVIYVEPIPLGFRIRDLAEGEDGRILLRTDSGAIVALAAGPTEPVGSVVFEGCRSCHESPPGSESLGPSLKGIVGAAVARESGFQYSSALSQLGGKWTEPRLDAFLSDPNSYAPGSAMAAGQVRDAKERSALIAFLRTYR
jgi:cytochrome c2